MYSKFLFLICLLTSTSLLSQFTKEHTYPNASNIGSNMNTQQLYMVTLEVAGQKYVHIDRANKKIDLYNLNHSLFKSISYANATDLSPNYDYQDILYISQKLFDADNEIELMFVDQFFSSTSTNVITQIINEGGSILFTENNAAPIARLNVPQAQQPIYNTTAGTKMILSHTNGDAVVYSITGTLSLNITANNNAAIAESLLFPNPSNKSVTISNSPLPFSSIQIYTLEGKVISNLTINETFTYELNIDVLPQGQFYSNNRLVKN